MGPFGREDRGVELLHLGGPGETFCDQEVPEDSQAGRVLEEGGFLVLARDTIDFAVVVGPIERTVGGDGLAGGKAHRTAIP